MDQEMIEAVLSGSVPDVREQLGDLSPEGLQALLEAERSGRARRGVLEALEAELAKAGAQATSPANAGELNAPKKGVGKEGRGEETPEWQKAEYTGPLTGDQAMWRNAHLSRK